MKELETKFSFLRPSQISDSDAVQAWFTLKNKRYRSKSQSIAGLNLGFNTPEENEIVAQNRLNLLSALDLDPDWAAYADQVHSNRVQVVSQGGTYPSTDGLITQIPGLTLGIQVADCAAVLLWDGENKVIGALHAGWRGAVAGIVPKGIEKMSEQGANPNKIKAFVSPCLSLQNFEVGQEVAEQFPVNFVDYEQFEKPHVDLKGFIVYQLREVGLKKSNIEISEYCTIEESENLYSYRREGKQSGRMLALIQIKENR